MCYKSGFFSSVLFFLKILYFDNRKRRARQLVYFLNFSNFAFCFSFLFGLGDKFDKIMNKFDKTIRLIKQYIFLVSKGYNQMNLQLSYDKVIFLSHPKARKVVITCSYSKEDGHC